MEDKILVDKALESGAHKAVVIPQSSIVLSKHFRDICATNACGKYGRCWMCPPDIGPIEELMDRVRSFPKGLLYQYIGELEDSFDIEGMQEAAVCHAQLGQKLQKNVVPMIEGDSFHLSCGGCNLCERCAKADNQPCRFPQKALVPMEGAGIDVYNTTKDTPLKYINGQDTVTYFGLILFHEAETCIR